MQTKTSDNPLQKMSADKKAKAIFASNLKRIPAHETVFK